MNFSYKRISNKLFGLFTILALVFPFSAFADEAMDQFNSFKTGLLQLGIPKDDFVADYLTLELFYNTPFRSVVAKSLDQVSVKDFRLTITTQRYFELLKIFPNWKKIAQTQINKKYLLKSISISGHDSKFIWDPAQPKIYFIMKQDNNPEDSEISTVIFEEAVQRIPELKVDFAEERSLDNTFVIRKLKTKRLQPNEHIYPLHGFFGSPLLNQLAAKNKLDKFQLLQNMLIPQLADLLFETAFRIGIWTDSHSQNLWLVTDDSGKFHLAHKDYTALVINFLTRGTDPTYKRKPGEYLFQDENNLYEANVTSSGMEDSRISEASYNFANYALQTIIYTGDYSFEQKGLLLKSFFSAFVDRINKHYGIKIKFSEPTQFTLDKLDKLSHDIDIKGFSVWTAQRPFNRTGGLFGFSVFAMNEIQDQIYDHILGQRNYPINKAHQVQLEALFESKNFQFPINLEVLPYLSNRPAKSGNRLSNLKNNLSSPFFGITRGVKYLAQTITNHYEFTENYILKVTNSGKILSAVYYVNAQSVLKKINGPPTPPIDARCKQALLKIGN